MWNPEVDILYSSALIQPLSSSEAASDPWNNVRIPKLSSLKDPIGDDGWTEVVSGQSSYYSLLGTPINGLRTSEF